VKKQTNRNLGNEQLNKKKLSGKPCQQSRLGRRDNFRAWDQVDELEHSNSTKEKNKLWEYARPLGHN
jgi:hypothetical protein